MKIVPEVEAKFPRLAENVHMWNHHALHNWDSSISANLIITEARPNFLVFEFVVGEGHVNGYALRQFGKLNGNIYTDQLSITVLEISMEVASLP